ncbi:MAG: 4-hydroxythreonine-4-phosphate dehydrogenase PdxA [Dehalococcoidia bacterium]|nr:4-hydroxythreonine-4-phosphate dehydrogenase PdxA [Dehalococcoidia bacterium]
MSTVNSSTPLIAITLGDPSGIGPEVIAKALSEKDIHEVARLFVIGNKESLDSALEEVKSKATTKIINTPSDAISTSQQISVLETSNIMSSNFPIGELSLDSARASHTWVETAGKLALDNQIDAITTAPVNKEAWRAAGIQDTGHQEVFKRLSNSQYVATMLVSGELRCMHLSTHLSLSEACKYVTKENVLRAIRLTHQHFSDWGFHNPRIGIAALNPHASDGGLIGDSEDLEIKPAIAEAEKLGIKAFGPVPADSIFNQAIDGQYDVVVVMYHDQGHIPIKVHGFEESISVNLGLPFIRTSVDHGTAFDIAGKNLAQSVSMTEAIKLASSLATGKSL